MSNKNTNKCIACFFCCVCRRRKRFALWRTFQKNYNVFFIFLIPNAPLVNIAIAEIRGSLHWLNFKLAHLYILVCEIVQIGGHAMESKTTYVIAMQSDKQFAPTHLNCLQSSVNQMPNIKCI